MEKLSIIIPVFNEEDCLEETIQEMDELLEKSDLELEIIFVNDGSTDQSNKILESITKPCFKVLRHEINQGYGAALKTGIRNASFQYVGITDADGTYPNNEIPSLAHFLKDGYSMVVGVRKGQILKLPLLRRFPKWILNRLANYLSGFKIPDVNSGLRIMKKQDVERFLRILPDGFSFTITITLAMLTNNMPVYYHPINYYYRKGKSKIRPIHDMFNFLQLIVKTILYFSPLKIFVPLSLFLVIFAFVVLFGSWLLLGKVMDVTCGVILMTAVMVMVIGMLADLIDKKLQ